jgi:hypothetical protein
MSEAASTVLWLFAIPQALGLVVASLSRSLRARPWTWPVVTAVAFALIWYVRWSMPETRSIALDDGTRLEVPRVCGAAANFFFPGLVVLGLLNGLASRVLQAVLNHEPRRIT